MTNREPDAVAAAPHIHQVIFENEKLRVLQVRVRPGDQAALHWHPENINYIVKGGTLRFEKPNGDVVKAELHEGQVTSSPVGAHKVENIGTSEVQTVQVELKN